MHKCGGVNNITFSCNGRELTGGVSSELSLHPRLWRKASSHPADELFIYFVIESSIFMFLTPSLNKDFKSLFLRSTNGCTPILRFNYGYSDALKCSVWLQLLVSLVCLTHVRNYLDSPPGVSDPLTSCFHHPVHSGVYLVSLRVQCSALSVWNYVILESLASGLLLSRRKCDSLEQRARYLFNLFIYVLVFYVDDAQI